MLVVAYDHSAQTIFEGKFCDRRIRCRSILGGVMQHVGKSNLRGVGRCLKGSGGGEGSLV
jgi:hypothetical protein